MAPKTSPPTERSASAAAVTDPLREAFLRRSVETIARIAARADVALLAAALAAPTGVGALAHVLANSAAVGASAVELDPLAPLHARFVAHRADLLTAAGGAASSTDVAERLGITRQAVDKRRRAHSLLAVRIGGDWSYPLGQFDETTGEVVAGLPKLLAAFGETNPWVVLDFLLAPDESLGGQAPLAELKRGGLTAPLHRLVRIERGDGFA